MTDNLRWSNFELLIRIAVKELVSDSGFQTSVSETEIIFSLRHKKRMNRLFRTRCGSSYIPYPEVDTVFTRLIDRVIAVFVFLKEHCVHYWQVKRDRTEMVELYRILFDYLE